MQWVVWVFSVAPLLWLSSGVVYGAAEPLPSGVVLDRFADVPVDIATGDLKYYPSPDLFVKSRGLNLEVVRNYSSQRSLNGMFGYGWNWKHGDQLIFKANGVVEVITEHTILTAWKDQNIVDRWAQHCGNRYRWEKESNATGPMDGATAWAPHVGNGIPPLEAWG